MRISASIAVHTCENAISIVYPDHTSRHLRACLGGAVIKTRLVLLRIELAEKNALKQIARH